MSIRPVDLQVLLPKTAEASRSQQSELQRGNVEQQQFANQLEKKVEHNMHTVVQSTKTEKNDVNADESGRNKYHSTRKKKGTKAEGSKTDPKQDELSLSTSLFDMKV